MKFEKPVAVQDIARQIGADIKGDEGAMVYGMNEIHNVREGDLTFVDAEKYYKFTLKSEATIVIIDKEVELPRGKTILIVESPFHAYNEIALSYRKLELQADAIHPTADIHPTAEISVGCVIGKNVEIGAQSFLGPNTVVHDHCLIGNNVIIHANTTIGSDAFYYKGWNNKAVVYEKMNSIGTVLIHDDVEIGSGCTIDRGVSAATEIGQGTKIDNQVHLGHEVQIGRNCLLAAQVGVAGNVVIGNDVKVWGQVGIAKNLKIVDNVELLAQAGVARNIEKSGKYFGAPAGPAKIKMKELKILERLPLLWKSILKQKG